MARELTSGLVRRLADVVGDAHVIVDRDRLASYESDWTGRFVGRAAAVVRPATSAEVAAVVADCAAAGVALVPQGGNTGLVGGAAPLDGGLVLSLTRLDAIGDVDRETSQVTTGAGVTLGALQRALRPQGLEPAVDLAPRDSATLGGMAATNAGGTRVLRHGSMRAQVAGLEAVLGDGSVVASMRGLAKDTSGYDLSSLLVGSEGTLGVITALRLGLEPVPAHRCAAMVALRSVADAVTFAADLRDRLPSLQAAEMMSGRLLALVDRRRGATPPVDPAGSWVVLVECAGPADDADALASAVGRHDDLVADAALAGDGPRLRALWERRELATETLAAVGPPRKLDVSLPLGALDRFVRRAESEVAAAEPDAELHVFGHLLDGNLHCNMVGVRGDGDRLDGALLELAVSMGGSIGAEHGVGRAKRRWLPLVRSASEIAAFRAIKAALDPAGILNPGVLFPDG